MKRERQSKELWKRRKASDLVAISRNSSRFLRCVWFRFIWILRASLLVLRWNPTLSFLRLVLGNFCFNGFLKILCRLSSCTWFVFLLLLCSRSRFLCCFSIFSFFRGWGWGWGGSLGETCLIFFSLSLYPRSCFLFSPFLRWLDSFYVLFSSLFSAVLTSHLYFPTSFSFLNLHLSSAILSSLPRFLLSSHSVVALKTPEEAV